MSHPNVISAHKCIHTHTRSDRAEETNKRKRHSCVTNETSDLHSVGMDLSKQLTHFGILLLLQLIFDIFNSFSAKMKRKGMCDQDASTNKNIDKNALQACLIYSDARMSATTCCMLPVFMCPLLLLFVVFSCSPNGKSIYRQCFVSFVQQQPTANKSLCRFLLSLFFFILKTKKKHRKTTR